MCYVADHEPFDPALGAGGDVRPNRDDDHHVEFLRDADVVIHDAQYDADEYSERVGWGHSTDRVRGRRLQRRRSRADRAVPPRPVPRRRHGRCDCCANAAAAGPDVGQCRPKGAILEVGAAGRRRCLTCRAARHDGPTLDALCDHDADPVARRAAALGCGGGRVRRGTPPRASTARPSCSSVDHGSMLIVADVDEPGDRARRGPMRSSPSGARDRVGMLAGVTAVGVEARSRIGVTDWMVWPASAWRTSARSCGRSCSARPVDGSPHRCRPTRRPASKPCTASPSSTPRPTPASTASPSRAMRTLRCPRRH